MMGMTAHESGMQDMMDGCSMRMQRERAKTQMTLGKVITVLGGMSRDLQLTGLKVYSLHSYRGYYCDIAFEPNAGFTNVGALLDACKNAMGQVFEGYKGGEYVMGAPTPVWVSHVGLCGSRLMAINQDGSIEKAEEEQE